MSRVRSLFVAVAGIALLAPAALAYTYWNGTRYVESESGSTSGVRSGYSIAAVSNLGSVSPDDFQVKEEFLKAYLAQELDRLSAAQRNEDRRTLGGEATRRMRIRRVGEKLWKDAHENKEASNSGVPADKGLLMQEDISMYLQGRPLTGLFGMELGMTVDPKGYARVGTSNTYVFKPKKNFRGYKKYVFSLTPITHQIYGIRAADFTFVSDPAVAGQAAIKTEWEATKSALEKRFEKQAKMEIGTLVCPNFKLLFPGKGKTVERVIEVVFGSSITAVDLKLKQLAEEESEIVKRRSIDENVQEDVDAL